MTVRFAHGWLAALAACSVVAATVTASAQAELCVEPKAVGRVPIRGTVGYGAMYGAFDQVAQIYGAANMLEKKLLPLLRQKDVTQTFQYDVTAMVGAMRLPLCGDVGEIPKYGQSVGNVDISTGGMGAGIKTGPFTFFYAGNMTYRGTRDDNVFSRGAVAFGLPIVGSLASPIAPIYPRLVRDEIAVSVDFIAGTEITTPYARGAVGYVASQGLYTTFTQSDVRAFLSSVLNDGITQVPYLKVGLADLDWLVGDGAAKAIGSTSIYGRKLQYSGLPALDLAKEDIATAATPKFDFITAHLEQYGIGQHVDVMSALTYKPKTELREASLAVHTAGFMPSEQAINLVKKEDGIIKTCNFGVRASAGVVKVPTLRYYGVEGGYLFRGAVDAGGVGGCGHKPAINMWLSIGYNDAEILSVFPFVRNTTTILMALGLADE